MHVLAAGRFYLQNCLIEQDAVRFLRSTMATSSRGSCLTLQPQLLGVLEYFIELATLENGVSLEDVTTCRQSSSPIQKSAFGEKYAELSRAPFPHDP